MVLPHPIFKQPEDENALIWRYMDFSKYVSLLNLNKLFFSRADYLGDPFEGSYPIVDVESRKAPIKWISDEANITFQKGMSTLGDYHKFWLKFVAVNCWHMSNHESAAMWRLYSKNNEGIAIQSTYTKLKKAIIDTDNKIFLGSINYIDYNIDALTEQHPLSPFLHKRKSFEHEKEIRALIIKYPYHIPENSWDKISPETIASGIYVKVDLSVLISKVYIAPSAPNWFIKLIKDVTLKFDLDFEISQSKLDDSPIY